MLRPDPVATRSDDSIQIGYVFQRLGEPCAARDRQTTVFAPTVIQGGFDESLNGCAQVLFLFDVAAGDREAKS
jgi:hypothetical protein